MFNDILLAFKYCYDEEYEPNWADNAIKYNVVYDTEQKEYYVKLWADIIHNEIMFSAEEAALKCATYLNKIDPNGNLIK